MRERKLSTTLKPTQLASSSHTSRAPLPLHPVKSQNPNLWFFRIRNEQCLNCGKEKHVIHADQCSENVAISATETDKAKGFVETPMCATCGKQLNIEEFVTTVHGRVRGISKLILTEQLLYRMDKALNHRYLVAYQSQMRYPILILSILLLLSIDGDTHFRMKRIMSY